MDLHYWQQEAQSLLLVIFVSSMGGSDVAILIQHN